MTSELRGLLDNEDVEDEEGPFTKPSPPRRRQEVEEEEEEHYASKKKNIITRNKITSLLLLAGVVLVLIISAVVIYFIVQGSDKDIEEEIGSNNTTIAPQNDSNTTIAPQNDSNTTIAPQNDSNTIIAPQNDHSSYKVLVLPNQLRVVLISDPDATEAAAAIDVNAGSLNDPVGVDGLAHFCEHMLFLGTKKYPGKSEYSSFLSANGGYDNAYTSTQNTNYYFAVNLDALEEALDRFAQFFIAPLFTENSTYAEMSAVNSEYDKDLNDPGWKQWQLLKNVSNPQHPFSRFNIGSIGTLNIGDIRDRLITYYNTSYSANQMQLAVIGNNTLSTLEQWVKSKFSSIPNRHLNPLNFNTTSFPPAYSSKLVYYAPGEPAHSVSIFWQLPPLQGKYRNRVSALISRYLGDEGHGSILEYLKMKLWASSLSASTEVNTDSYTLYTVSVELTEDGLIHVKDVVSAVFQYIRILVKVTDNQWNHMWDEHINSSDILFNNRDKSKPYDFVSGLAASMRTIEDPADFLSPPSRAVLNVSLINNVLNKLTPSNSVVFVGSPNFLNATPASLNGLPRPHLDAVEPWFNTSFSKNNIPDDVLSAWATDNETVKLSLPPENKFIPKQLKVLSPDKDHSKIPTQVKNINGLSVWWLQDDQFFSPKINLVCSLETPVAYSSSRNFALTQMFMNYVAQALTADLYPATLTGYSKTLGFNPSGLTIQVNGYSDEDVMEQYLTVLLQGIYNATVSVNGDVFTVTQKALMSYYEEYNYNQLPYHYARSYTQYVILQEPYFKHSTILSELASITSDEMLQHAKNLSKSFNTTCFVHGNLLKDKAIFYATKVKQMLSQSATTVQQPFCSKQIVKVDQGASSVAISPLNPTDKNSLVNVIFQIGRSCIVENKTCSNSSLRNYALSGLLQLVMKDHCFSYLRTVKQLGYVATCYAAKHSDVLSFELLVQSGTYQPDYILNVMEEFLNSFYNNELVRLIGDDVFSDTKSSYVDVISQKQLTLKDKTQFLWNYIALKSYQFDIHSQVAEVVRSLTGEDLRSFYNDNILSQTSHQKMIISIFGYPSTPQYVNGTTHVDYLNIDDFKSNADFFATVSC